MVLEGVVVELVNRFLGDYIDNLDKSQLSLSIWGGDVVLNNLFVKENLLNELDLPVRVIYGNLGKLTLKIPWSNLYTEPTIALIDGLYIIVVPNSGITYNEEKENKAKWDTKQKELSRIEEAKKREAEKDLAKDVKPDTFVEKLVANVIKNLEVTVTNIHVRFEDNITNPEKPFSVGVTLSELSLRTTDQNWQLKTIKEDAAVIFKLVKLDSLSLYWNCGSESYSTKEKTMIQPLLKDTIASSTHKVDFLYLLAPMISSARLKLNMKPEQTGFIMPKILLDVVFEEIILSLAKSQYQILMEFIESLERMKLADKYRKYRPSIPKKQHGKEWWKFAYTCVLEETVRRRRKMWSWQHIKAHRELCRKYKDLYKNKLITSKKSAPILSSIEECERELDVFNITIMRQQAEIIAKKEGGKKDSGSTGWFGGWFSWGSKQEKVPDEQKSVTDKVQDAMTADEKRKLYDAIGYQESAVDTVFPKEYVAVNLQLRLSKLCLKLRDTTLNYQDVMNLQLQDIIANVTQRPGGDAVGVQASLKSLNIFGLPLMEGSPAPAMVSSKNAATSDSGTVSTFVDFQFETNPLDGLCDTRIKVGARPVEVIYDAKTINSIAEFFKPPDDVYVVQLQAAAMAKLDTVKQQTATGLQYALEQKKFTDISVSLQPTCIIIPEKGVYAVDCRVLVCDLGELTVLTEKPSLKLDQPDGGTMVLPLEELKKQAYTKFCVKLTSLQLLFANTGEQWRNAAPSSHMHILKPMGLKIDLFQCVIPSSDLPKMRVVGELPEISLSMSDQKLCDILGLVSSIPFPQSAAPPGGLEDEDEFSQLRGPDAKLMTIREDAVELVGTLASSPQVTSHEDSAFLNATNMEMIFEIKKISIALAQRQGNADVPTLKVVIESLGVELTARDFDTSVTAYLGGIYVQHVLFKAYDAITKWHADHGVHEAISDGPLINLINTPIMDGTTHKLLKVVVLMANKKHPEFSTTYHNTLQKIDIEFTVLEVLLHQDALLSTLAVLQSIQQSLEKQKPPQNAVPAVVRRSHSVISSTISGTLKKMEKRRVRKKPAVEIIDVALSAELNNLSIAICTQDSILADIKITGLKSEVEVKKSQTFVRASLGDISIYDHVPDAIFPKILSFGDDDVFKMEATVFNDATEGSRYLDMQAVDTKVTLSTGRMKIVFLNKFVQDLLRFVSPFQVAKDKLAEAGAAVADRATAVAQDMSTRSSRLLLNINLKGPVIIVPQNSRSNNSVVVNLGELTVKNSFQMTGGGHKSKDGLPAILDRMIVDLTQLKISRALVLGTEEKAECLLLEPVTLSVILTRNLSASWYHGSPDVEVYGKLDKFSMLVSQGDLKTVMQLLNENLQEGNQLANGTAQCTVTTPTSAQAPTPLYVTEVPAVVHVEQTPSGHVAATSSLQPSPSQPAAQSDVYQTMKLNVGIENIKLELYTGDSDLSVGESKRESAHALARFQLQEIGLKAEMFSDSSMKAHFSLHTCELDDVRPNKEAGITKGNVMRMIVQSSDAAALIDPLNMIDVSFVQDSQLNRDVDMKVNGLHIVVCLEYLLKLKDFVMDAMPAAPASPSPAPATPVTTTPAPAPVPSVSPGSPVVGGETKIQMSLVKPEIVLVENTMNIDSNAIILSLHVDSLVRISAVHQIIKGNIRGLSIVSCIYAPEKREASKSQILQPLDIDIQSNAPSGKNHHVEVIFLTDVILSISSSSIRTITATLSSLSVPPAQGAEDELKKIPKDLWTAKKFETSDHWFLEKVVNIDTAVEAEKAKLTEQLSRINQALDDRGEQMVLGKCRFIVKLLGGVGRRTVPFIITDMSLRNVDVRNWSSMMSMGCEMTLEVAYYNEQLAVWEPLIEPVETETRHRPWEIALEMHQTDLLEWDEVDAAEATPPPPQMAINVVSNDMLQITVTKTALDVFSKLSQSFGAAYRLAEAAEPDDTGAPFIVKNECGTYVSVRPGSAFQVPQDVVDGIIGLENSQSLQLFNKLVETPSQSSVADSPFNEVLDDQPKILSFTFDDFNATRELTIKRAEKRAFSFDQRGSPGDVRQIVVQTDMSYGCKTVSIKSVVQVHNCLPYGVELYYKLGDDVMGRCGDVSPGDTSSLPLEAIYTDPYELYFKPRDGSYRESATACKWNDLKDLKSSSASRVIECKAWKDNSVTVYFVAKVMVEPILFESTMEASAKLYTIQLNPTVEFRNLLPCAVGCKMEGTEDSLSIEAGEKTALLHVNPASALLQITLTYQSKQWQGRFSMDSSLPDLSVFNVETTENDQKLSLDLGIHCERLSTGCLLLSLYCPYWMINKTERDLFYKASEDYIVEHKANNKDIVLFLFKNSVASSKQKASLKLDGSEWSDKFSLDTVGSVGKVECKFKSQNINGDKGSKSATGSFVSVIGVKITLSSNGLTKIITFTPFFVFVNKAQFAIECRESLPVDAPAPWLEIPAGSCLPFWPTETDKRKLLVARIKGTALETQPFDITEAHNTLLQLYHEYAGIYVECTPIEGAITVVFQHYCPGFASVLLVNWTSSSEVDIWQKDLKDKAFKLAPGFSQMYTWEDPTGKRELVWSFEGKEFKDELIKDGLGEFESSDKKKFYWVSFLSGAQRVLLLSENENILDVTQMAGKLERIEKEISLNMQGIGLSLVDNNQRKEIAYMAITSSGVIWEKLKRKRFKPLKMKYNTALEEGFQRYLAELSVAGGKKIDGHRQLDNKLEVDFAENKMLKPHKATINRTFHYGFTVRYSFSEHQMHLHLRLHRLQLDNQLPDAVFPTVLAPIPPPKTVAVDCAPKPFTELSVVINKSDYSNVLQFKYCQLLIQEFSVKVDQGFLGALLGLFSSGEVSEEQELAAFHQDRAMIDQTLMEGSIQSTNVVVRNYYDKLHCSPIKIHLSFSMYGGDDDGEDGEKKSPIQWHVLNLFLQSVGIVLTDIQDVVFKLAYFERKHTFYSQQQLISELTRHYSQQAIKQMYVLVLGLDVLGNPFGVLRGLAEGIEDLFYEPYQGAIQGPEEFAEGLALGVRSMLGHAVGGAAGAVSRITGALGKGIATLTFDDEYQKKRREAINKRPADLKEGLARGGQGLIMGVFHGVTGIVTKPVEGARQEGVGGFFKGVGKGLVGVFTRPASGVVDFASNSFDGIRRIAELSDEVRRLRPARFFQPDGIVRSYVYREAEGNQILKDAGRGKFAAERYVGHLITSADGRTVLMVTEKRLIFITKGDVLGHWDCDWDYSWELLKEAPLLTPKGIQILLKEKQKKLIGSSTIGKMIAVSEKDRKYAELLVSKMRIVMNAVSC